MPRRAIIRVTLEYSIEVPDDATPESIEFYRNNSRWCANNMIGELEALIDETHCLCDYAHTQYLREDLSTIELKGDT